jgi:hypothetical protein
MAAPKAWELNSVEHKPRTIEYDPNPPDPDTDLARLPNIIHTSRWLELPTWSSPPPDSFIGHIHAKQVMLSRINVDGSRVIFGVCRYRRHSRSGNVDVWYRGTRCLTQAPPEPIAKAHFPGEGEHAGVCTGTCYPCSYWREYKLYRWPGQDLTVHVKERMHETETVQRGWERWRVMTNRGAAAVLHRIINTGLRLRKLGNTEGAQVLCSEALVKWAHASVETFEGGNYRRIRVWEEGDDTIVAAFRKGDQKSLWEQVPLRELSGNVVKKTEYRMTMCGVPLHARQERDEHDQRMPPQNGLNGMETYSAVAGRTNNSGQARRQSYPTEQVEDDISETPPPWDWNLWQGTMWVENIETGHLYQIMDDEETGHEHSRAESILKDCFRKRHWKMVDVLYRTPGDFNKVVLWACLDENNVICDVSRSIPLGELQLITDMTYSASWQNIFLCEKIWQKGFSMQDIGIT